VNSANAHSNHAKWVTEPGLYVDDMLIAAKSIIEVNKLKVLLSRKFDMKDLGAAKKILRMEIRRDKDAKRLGYLKLVM
jgi:hypothetical protein